MEQQLTIEQPLEATYYWQPMAIFALLMSNFVLFGLTIGVQGVLWAELLPALHVSMGAFGSAQLISPLISVALLLFGGQLSARAGKKRLSVASLALLGAAALTLAASANLWGLLGALVLLGVGNGLFETAMNGAALDWEKATQRSALNYLHAGFSAGAVVGALGAGALIGWGWSASGVLIILAGLSCLATIATLVVRYPPTAADGEGAQQPGATIGLLLSRRVLVMLALICMLGAIGESVANLWSVIYLREQGAGALLGGATFALLSGAMLVGRIANAPLVDRLGPRASLLGSGVGLILSAILLLIPGGVPLAIAAFMLLGLAVAGVVPTVLTAAARQVPGNSGAIAGGMLAAVYLSFVNYPGLKHLDLSLARTPCVLRDVRPID